MRLSALLLATVASCGPAGIVPAGLDPAARDGDFRAADEGDGDPGAGGGGPKVERCGNAVDDDLDGLVDDGCACVADASQECWIGPRFAREQGLCHAGRQACLRGTDGTLGWGPCEGVQLPVAEDCGNGADDDCDARPDCEDPDCAGACGGGCASEELACRDGSDDDCDGETDCDDSDCAASCEGCADYEWDCDDGLDDDCNGDTDCEDIGCETSCANDDGGDRGCDDENGCDEDADPPDEEEGGDVVDPPNGGGDDDEPEGGGDGEQCNGVDDDGDGRIDEDRACGQADDGGGDCVPGALRICDAYCGVHQRCDAGGSWGACRVDALCAAVTSCSEHADCARGDWCDFGWCVAGTGDGWPCADDEECGPLGWCAAEQGVCVLDCLHHGDCGEGLVCDLGACVADPYVPGAC